MHVLIVEPQAHLAEIWAAHLRRQGLEVRVAAGQSEAVAALATQPFDVLVLDLELAEGDSPIAVADLAGYRHPEIKVIFVNRQTFFSDGSIFDLTPNACALVQPDVPPDDLAAIVEFHARRS